jgi:hypothetical protein
MDRSSPSPVSGQANPAGGGVLVPKSCSPHAVPTRARLRVWWQRSAVVAQGRTFYDPLSQLVQYHTIPHAPYRSFVSVPPLRIDLDNQGTPIFVELDISGDVLEIDSCLRPPLDFELGTLRLLDCPILSRWVCALTDEANSIFYIKLSDGPVATSLQISRGAIWEIDAGSYLSGLWLLKCQDDPYGRGRRRWRSRTWKQARRQALLEGSPARLSPISIAPEESEPEE